MAEDGFWSQFFALWKERTSSPIYFAFAISFIAWNWKLVYSLFFVNEEFLPNLTSLEYALRYSHAYFLLNNAFFNSILNFLNTFAVPVFLTYLGVRWLPYLHVWAHKHHRIFHYARREEEDRQRNKYEDQRVQSLQKLRASISRQVEVSEEIVDESAKLKDVERTVDERLTDEQRMERGVVQLADDPSLQSAMRQARDAIYKTQGRYVGDFSRLSQGYNTLVDPAALARLDSHGLIRTDAGKNNDLMTFTERGKALLRALQSEKNF